MYKGCATKPRSYHGETGLGRGSHLPGSKDGHVSRSGGLVHGFATYSWTVDAAEQCKASAQRFCKVLRAESFGVRCLRLLSGSGCGFLTVQPPACGSGPVRHSGPPIEIASVAQRRFRRARALMRRSARRGEPGPRSRPRGGAPARDHRPPGGRPTAPGCRRTPWPAGSPSPARCRPAR